MRLSLISIRHEQIWRSDRAQNNAEFKNLWEQKIFFGTKNSFQGLKIVFRNKKRLRDILAPDGMVAGSQTLAYRNLKNNNFEKLKSYPE